MHGHTYIKSVLFFAYLFDSMTVYQQLGFILKQFYTAVFYTILHVNYHQTPLLHVVFQPPVSPKFSNISFVLRNTILNTTHRY